MKRLVIFMLVLCSVAVLRAQNPVAAHDTVATQSVKAMQSNDTDALWDGANTAYVNGDYDTAIARYDSIAATGRVSAKLYYNLGNAHFKQGNTALSILNYNRALRLAPANADIRYNLAIAQSYTKDNIAKMPEFFLLRWFKTIRTAMSSNLWAWISIALLAMALTSALLYLLSGRMALRKTGFYCGLAALVLFIFATVNAAVGKREMLESDRAIVLNNAAPVKSSPDSTSKDIFMIHEGTAVRILSRLGKWCEISIDDGNKGWIEASTIEVI